jgi:hypothetical protein
MKPGVTHPTPPARGYFTLRVDIYGELDSRLAYVRATEIRHDGRPARTFTLQERDG